ncbi:MAG TPA: transketolase C-terminal domain-containing protein [Gaiellaceae bacterium]
MPAEAPAARQLKFNEALHEALDLALAADERVYLLGLGVPDPKGIFGTTSGLVDRFGSHRVLDMPTAENGMTGIAIGSALVGMRPVMVHQRIDFATLAIEQIVNQAAKWRYAFGGEHSVPIVIRLIVGRGWGQGPQHSQSLQSWFAHIPGLKVVMPVTPYDAKGLMLAAIEDDDPVIFIEHRWLHQLHGVVPEGHYVTPIGPVRRLREGADVTIAATSYMAVEALRAADVLARGGVEADVLAVTTLRPLDASGIIDSVRSTGRLVVADTSWRSSGFGAELVARVSEEAHGALRAAPRRLGTVETPVPTTPALAQFSYPRVPDLVRAVAEVVETDAEPLLALLDPPPHHLDVPDSTFTGPF